MADFRFATFNLFHFAEPGIFWHERDPKSTYTPEQWQAKRAWITGMLAQMNADVVGFQEVVSFEALKDLVAAAGYPHFYNAGVPIFDREDSAIYVNATVAIASRHPFTQVGDLIGVADIDVDTVVDPDFRFSRTPVAARIDLAGIGGMDIYVCHLKSQGAFVDPRDVDPITDWAEKIKTYYSLRNAAGVDQVAKRAAEAGVVYRLFRRAIDRDNDAPVLLLGDLNEGPDSHTIGILTQGERVFSWGSIPANGVPPQFAFLKHVYKLYDTWPLVPTQLQGRPITHSSSGHGSILDYGIVSNGLNPNNPRRRGTVTKVEVFDDHFRDGPPKGIASDHAPVIVTIAGRDV
jgi:endonuclease/exonuclease/phosphatase family metal-dependent hydrolase